MGDATTVELVPAGRGRYGKDEVLARGLASGLSLVRAAAAAKMSERTARRRLHDPEFKALLSRLRSAVIERVAEELGDAAIEAVRTLRELLKPGIADATRRSSAATLLQFYLPYEEQAEFAARLERLERLVGESS